MKIMLTEWPQGRLPPYFLCVQVSAVYNGMYVESFKMKYKNGKLQLAVARLDSYEDTGSTPTVAVGIWASADA